MEETFTEAYYMLLTTLGIRNTKLCEADQVLSQNWQASDEWQKTNNQTEV